MIGRGWPSHRVAVLLAVLTVGCQAGTDPLATGIEQALVAEVEHRRLEESVTAHGSVTAERRFELRVPGDGVVTAVSVAVGDEVSPGTVLAHVDGAPVVAFEADVPVWRDINVGDRGPDVDALRAVLGTAGSDDAWGPEDAERFRELAGPGVQSEDPEGVQQLIASRRAVEDATAAVERAERAHADAAADRDRQIARAKRDLDAAREALEAARNDPAMDHEELQRQVGLAEEQLDEARATNLTATSDALADARTARERARADLARQEHAATPAVSSRSYVFVGSLPATVIEPAEVGASVTDAPLAVLASEGVVFKGSIAADVDLEVGMTATVGEGADAVDATVRSVGRDDDGRLEVVLEPDADVVLPAEATSARLVIAETAPTLAVPVAALWTTGDGTVLITRADTDRTSVEVTVGRTVGGWVELLDPAGLARGDRVRTGVWIDGDPDG